MLFLLGGYGPVHPAALRAAVRHPYIAGVRCMQRGELLSGCGAVHGHPDVGLPTALITMPAADGVLDWSVG